jgi:hypothetical protein
MRSAGFNTAWSFGTTADPFLSTSVAGTYRLHWTYFLQGSGGTAFNYTCGLCLGTQTSAAIADTSASGLLLQSGSPVSMSTTQQALVTLAANQKLYFQFQVDQAGAGATVTNFTCLISRFM